MISTKMLIAIQAVWCTSFRTQSLLYLFASVHHGIQVPNLEAPYLKGGRVGISLSIVFENIGNLCVGFMDM